MHRGNSKVQIVLIPALLLLVGLTSYQISEQLRFRSACRAAEEALQRRDFPAASRWYDRCLEIRPTNLEVRLLAARTARRRGDPDEARRHLQVYDQQNGPGEAADLEHQLLRIQFGDMEEASRLFADYTGDNLDKPGTPYVLETLAEWGLRALESGSASGLTFEQLQAGDYLANLHHTVALWLRLRIGQADHVQGLVWRGRAHLLANEYADALADFREALQIDPRHFESRERLATALVRSSPKEAAAHLQVLHDRTVRSDSVRLALAGCRRTLGQLEEARQLLDEVLAEHPSDVSALVERGLVDLDRQHPEEAGQVLRQALQSPDEPRVHLALSRCLRRDGKKEEATQHLETFRQLTARREWQREEMAQRIKAEQQRQMDDRARKRQKIPAGSAE